MKRSCLVLLSLLLAADAAHAAGLNLAWDQCYADAPPVVRKLFACNKNTGFDALAASFVPANDHLTSSLLEVLFDFQTRSGGALPAWWNSETTGGCISNQIAVDGAPPLPLVTCQSTSPVSAPRFFVLHNNFQYPTPNRMMFEVSAQAGGTPLVAGVEYFACTLRISHTGAAGPGACSGCLEPVAITLTRVRVGSGTPEFISVPAAGNVVGWQQDLPVAARNVTWGAVKALYH